MKFGNKTFLIGILFLILLNPLKAEQKITSTPLLNIDEIKPSFELSDEKNENISPKQSLKEKKKH